jgi:sec-independent protein translocase protein TatA
MICPVAIASPGPFEMMIILGIGVLLFGSRLPEVGRSLGKGMIEFKKGLQGIEDEPSSTAASKDSSSPAEEHVEASAPKFEIPDQESDA